MKSALVGRASRFRRPVPVDVDLAVADLGVVGADRDHARRSDHLTGAEVEGTVVELTLHDLPVDLALRQQPGSVGAVVVNDAVAIANLEHRNLEVVDGDLQALPV